MPRPEFACCTTRHLPPPLRLRAAWDSALARQDNAPGLLAVVHALPAHAPIPPEAITLLRGKFWPAGSKLRVAFKGGSPAVNNRVLSYASKWSAYANLDFVAVPYGSACDILVGYDQPGYWSLIGTDSPYAMRQGQQSLNLEGFDSVSDPPPDSEWDRVVCHEFGHALGAEHEQMRPEVVARLDRAKVHAWLRQTQGWDDATIDAQMFQMLDMSRELSSAEDDTSIMMYAIPASVTTDGRPIAGGAKINDLDGKTMAAAYPGRVVPNPVPPVPPRPVYQEPTAVAVIPSAYGPDTLHLLATVSGTAGETANTPPSGAVAFEVDGTAPAVVPMSGRWAAHVTGPLAPGKHTAVVRYSGDGVYSPSSVSLPVEAPKPTPPLVHSFGPFTIDPDGNTATLPQYTKTAVTALGIVGWDTNKDEFIYPLGWAIKMAQPAAVDAPGASGRPPGSSFTNPWFSRGDRAMNTVVALFTWYQTHKAAVDDLIAIAAPLFSHAHPPQLASQLKAGESFTGTVTGTVSDPDAKCGGAAPVAP